MTSSRRAARTRLSPPDTLRIPSPECRELLAHFWDYLDGNCSPELAGRIEAHLASCLPCLRIRRLHGLFLASLARMRRRSRAPRRVHDRVRKTLAAERRARRR